MYLPSLREEVSQGDIFNDLVYRYIYQEPSDPDPQIESRVIQAMLLTYDCEYDKPDAAYIYMGEVRPMNEISASTRGHVRSHRVLYTFPLLVHRNLPDESYIDFRRILRFDKNTIAQSSLTSQRVVSVTDTAREALRQQMALFFGFNREGNS